MYIRNSQMEPNGALGAIGRALKEEVSTTVAGVDTLTDLPPTVSASLKLLKWAVHHAALHLLSKYQIDLSAAVPAIRLIATNGGYGGVSTHAVNHLLRKTGIRSNGKTLTMDDIVAEYRKYFTLSPGDTFWTTLRPPMGSPVILALGRPPRGVKSGLHEAMHALASPKGLSRIGLLDEGGPEYFARQAARAQGLSYEKSYPRQEAIFGKLATDFGDQVVANAFFTDALPAFELAFNKKYGDGGFRKFVNDDATSPYAAAAALNLDYDTMTENRP